MPALRAALVAALACASALHVATALPPHEKIPPRGWRSWNCFLEDVNQTAIQAQVDSMADSGLLKQGYSHVGIDDGWQACGTGVNGTFHDAQGRPLINMTRFPSMSGLTAYGKSKGIKVGWYGNNCGCCERGHEPEGGHVPQDVKATIDLGFGGLKVDGCGPAHNITAWTQQLRLQGGGDVMVENCGDNHDTWSPPLPSELKSCDFDLYRISPDIAPIFESAVWNLNHIPPFAQPGNPMSRPGCWAYPDMLQVGPRLSVTESRTHFAAWAIVSAPLILGFDLSDAAALKSMLPIVANERALEINAAWDGEPGRLVRNASATFHTGVPHGAGCRCCNDLSSCGTQWDAPVFQVWAKSLGQGRQAVLAINLSRQPQPVSVAMSELGFAGEAALQEVWSGKQLGSAASHAETLAPHDSFFLIASKP